MSIIDSIKNRRSVYPPQMDPNQKIEDKKIEQILEMANYAPSHKRTEPWRFIVFSGEQITSFYENMLKIYKNRTTDEDSIALKKRKWEAKAASVSHVVAICMKRDGKKRVPRKEEEWAVSCAVQNIWLAASHFGISGYWGTGELAYTQEMKEYLNLSEEDACMGFLQLGVLKEGINLPPKKPMNGMEEKVEWR